ncbi:MAG TPA: hypothetical protein VIT89_07330 [Solirubrobacterales bacterium]
MSPVRASRRRLAAAFSAALVVALALVALGGAGSAAAATCPSFKVLHDDRIGTVVLPAGNYEVTTDTGLSCQAASQLFSRFLQDWDGNLPKPWRAVAEGSGKASFTRPGLPGFSVSRSGASGGGSSELGRLCPDAYTVNAASNIGPLFFAKAQYLLYIPARSAITCRRAAVLFTRFLAAPGGMLPAQWRMKSQTATFFKPAHPLRSAFRVETADGVV